LKKARVEKSTVSVEKSTPSTTGSESTKTDRAIKDERQQRSPPLLPKKDDTRAVSESRRVK
jgi:hypothetical protein